LTWLRSWADLLDARFRIPGTRIRFGLDPILSLVPGLGDLASPIFAVVLLVHAIYLGVPRVVMLRMLANAMVDAVIGAVPIVGNVGDVFWRANLANLALLERHARPGVPPTRGDYVFLFAMAALIGALVIGPVVLGIWLTIWLWRAL
jgi:ABC-type antimicrobial peptide transport system permease subunit